ncbi:MAG: hypothetical protein JRJ59_11340 [Deltaproteobacteria bacterium]|nr:hypothetical protein [Deltaproteobacteria bacterium]
MKPRVDPGQIKARAAALRQLGQRQRRAFLARAVGRPAQMLVETRRDPRTGLLTGLSPNYLPLLLEGGDELMNRIVPVSVDRVWGNKLMARRL